MGEEETLTQYRSSSFAAPLILLLVLAFQFVSKWLDQLKKVLRFYFLFFKLNPLANIDQFYIYIF